MYSSRFKNCFPSVLKKALQEHLIDLPDSVQTNFEEIFVYRGVTISAEKPSLDRSDFMSQMERQAEKIGLENLARIPRSSQWKQYSCSCFKDKEELIQAFKLPRQDKRIAFGRIHEADGAVLESFDDNTTHVHWFLYDGVDPSEKFQLDEND